jgi:alanine racemase
LVSNVIQINEIKKGDDIGYDSYFTSDKPMKVAIIPLG